MNIFVIADAHGNVELVAGLLQQEGLISIGLNRHNLGVTVVQLGDLCNCVASSIEIDKACLGFAPEWFDVYLVGNHEYPYFGGGAFDGYWPDGEIRQALLQFRERGLIRAAYAADDVLVTHAGLTSHWLREFGGWDLSAAQIAEYTNHAWDEDPRALIFEACGRSRGGRCPEGGILWADWRETKPKHLRQLIGHTGGTAIRRRAGATCIDLGAGKHSTRIAGAWIRDGVIETVIYDGQRRE